MGANIEIIEVDRGLTVKSDLKLDDGDIWHSVITINGMVFHVHGCTVGYNQDVWFYHYIPIAEYKEKTKGAVRQCCDDKGN